MATKKESRKKGGIRRFTRETIGELRKVSWPTRQEAMNLTVIVIVVMVFMGFLLSVTDIIAGRLLNLALGI
ncbi:MAG: preprotein translocase subunit SecE [Chloroflexi bacterium]|nr:preprotein translocase subunit SecE [Chloroflexota bacterium]